MLSKVIQESLQIVISLIKQKWIKLFYNNFILKKTKRRDLQFDLSKSPPACFRLAMIFHQNRYRSSGVRSDQITFKLK